MWLISALAGVAMINSQGMAMGGGGRPGPSLIKRYGRGRLPSETGTPKSRYQEGTRHKMKPPVAATRTCSLQSETSAVKVYGVGGRRLCFGMGQSGCEEARSRFSSCTDAL